MYCLYYCNTIHDKVCIVGAGPAGVHMALSLKKRGYSNVTIYEKTNRVGGKSFDIKYRGVAQPQGTIFAEPNYFDNLIPLAQEYGAGDYVRIPSYNVWSTNSASDPGSKLSLGHFVLGNVATLTNSSSPQINLGFVLKTVVHYVKLHKVEVLKEIYLFSDWSKSSKPISRILEYSNANGL